VGPDFSVDSVRGSVEVQADDYTIIRSLNSPSLALTARCFTKLRAHYAAGRRKRRRWPCVAIATTFGVRERSCDSANGYPKGARNASVCGGSGSRKPACASCASTASTAAIVSGCETLTRSGDATTIDPSSLSETVHAGGASVGSARAAQVGMSASRRQACVQASPATAHGVRP
jgi:hypothetical protein